MNVFNLIFLSMSIGVLVTAVAVNKVIREDKKVSKEHLNK